MAFEQYNKMASNFNSSFQPEEDDEDIIVESSNRSLSEIRENKELIPIDESKENLIADQEYILKELKVDIELIGDVTETLSSSLVQGSRASEFEAFASLMKERREHLKEYKEVNMELAKLENDIKSGTTNTSQNITNNTLVLNGNEAFDMILAARDGLDPKKEVK